VERTGDPEAPLAFNPEFRQEIVQEITDREIEYAAEAGIDYWAFCHYLKSKGDGWQLRNNLQAYLDSPRKHRIGFALICIGDHVGAGVAEGKGAEITWRDWQAYVAEYLTLFAEPTYQRVLDDRPLFFVFNPEGLAANLGDEEHGVQELSRAVAYLRAEAQAAGFADPYVVGMNAGGIWAARYIDDAGLDAVSAYRPAWGTRDGGRPFADLAAEIQTQFLDFPDMAGAGHRRVIVPCMSGADQRPRGPVGHYLEPEPGELRAHVLWALDYAYRHPERCESQSVLMYAWNEHSEGGFLCPLIAPEPGGRPDTRRLDEVADALRSWRPPNPSTGE
jgi:hypothetical protein